MDNGSLKNQEAHRIFGREISSSRLPLLHEGKFRSPIVFLFCMFYVDVHGFYSSLLNSQAMVRKRLPFQFIADDHRQRATLAKRIPAMKKKTMELSTLCDISVLLISTGGGNNRIETLPEN